MAGKFVIYCDDCPTKSGLEEKQITISQPVKREPLGLRQTISQAPAVAPSSSTNFSDEDQENDISMASLGSEYAPSISSEFNNSYGDISYDDLDSDDEIELNEAFKQHEDSRLFNSTDYHDDIESYLLKLERHPELRPRPNYMAELQTDIDSKKRAILVDWLIDISDEFKLQTETLFMCTAIVDRFLSKRLISTSNLQLLGTAAMFTASKYEEIYPPTLYQFVDVSADSCSGEAIIQMEQEILKTLNFQLSLPTISYFLKHLFAFNKFSREVYHLADYLCHLSLLRDNPFLEYYPSEIALAAVILAARQLDASSNVTPQLKKAFDDSNTAQLRRGIGDDIPFCIQALLEFQKREADNLIHRKFSSQINAKLLKTQKPDDELLY